ncbi:MAG: prolyl oligopeptidase family serine peptidase [Patescibacteria group bacterium]|nr:prolyl oligopeptidase family serine peptidase [Patescibacteria group bacterium]
MKKIYLVYSLVFLALIGVIYLLSQQQKPLINPLSNIKEKKFEKYSFENLKKTFSAKGGPASGWKESPITFGKIIKETPDYTSRVFYFDVPSTGHSTLREEPSSSDSKSSGQAKKVSGLANIPKKQGAYPVIVMFRGYVDKEIYDFGVGTQHGGEYFAQNGFITLAPDFLGYSESSPASTDSLEDRFQTYTTALTLLSSIKNINEGLINVNSETKADYEKVGIWGHSNGGQIALSILEITGRRYPTVLWAPVSKPFPYSIFYYTDELDDHGKYLRKIIADFEKGYDIELYSLTNYFSWINAPIEIHQGGDDEAVPQKWSNQLVDELKKLGKNVTYHTYPGENHNFNNGSWETAIQRSTSFYKSFFE